MRCSCCQNHGKKEEPVVREMLKAAARAADEEWQTCRALAKKARKEKDRCLLYLLADEKKRCRKTLKRMYFYLFRRELPHDIPKVILKGGFKENLVKAMMKAKENARFYEETASRLRDDSARRVLLGLAEEEERCARRQEEILNAR
ncbi:MAG: hypothetical protein ACOX8R_08635 [Bacillota bacterium]